jgi:hypothetical protein
VEPQQKNAQLVVGSGNLADIVKSGNSGWSVTKDTSQQICIEIWANTGACETEVSIQGRVAAVEEDELP